MTHPGGWKGAYEKQKRRAEIAEAEARCLRLQLAMFRAVKPEDADPMIRSVLAAHEKQAKP